ncbi:MAG TPA: hypothetical protein VH136_18255 [Trebonia sp.]|jgi:hypothetical protein|nr:hypothetical protein [Trebonia sp.]
MIAVTMADGLIGWLARWTPSAASASSIRLACSAPYSTRLPWQAFSGRREEEREDRLRGEQRR